MGAATHEEVQQLAERNFGWIPKAPEPPRVSQPEWKPYEKQEIVITEKNAPAPLVGLLFRGVPLNHPDAIALDLMTMILGGGESSRIYRRVVAEDQSAVMAMAGNMNLEQDGVIATGSVMAPIGSNPDVALSSMAEEIQRIQTELVTEAELEKARNQMLKSLVTESLTVESKASALGSAAVLEGDVSRINTRLERIRSVTTEDIRRVAREYLNLENALTGKVKANLMGTLGGMLGLGGDSAENAPITGKPEVNPPPPGKPGLKRPADRITESPIAGPLQYEAETGYETLTLDNGLTILVVENHEVPYISVQLGMEAGAWTEEKPGTASMALSMLSKGTVSMSEKELATELETFAISLGGSAGMDSSSVSMGCLPEQADRGMKLMSDIVLHNTMPEEEFQKLLKQQRTGLAISSKEPSYIADREFRRRLYGQHPYARTVTGELEDLKNLELEDLKKWWATYARPDMTTLVFAGDIDLAEAGSLAKKYFIEWQALGEKPAPELAEIPDKSATQVYLVDNSGVQSEIRVGHLSMTREDSDYFASRVVSGYFGGAFSSRLNETIRVEKGLTYGARGGFSASKRAGSFSISTFSKNASTVEAVQAIMDEVLRLKSEAPNEKELTNTISYFTGSYPATRETSQQVAGELWSQKVLGLPDDYSQQMLSAVAATTAEMCQAVAQKHVDQESLVIVVVGPAKQLKEGLEKIAPVTVVE